MDINQILNPIKTNLNKETVMESFHSEYDEMDDFALAMEAVLDGEEIDEGIDPDLDEDEDMTTDDFVNSIEELDDEETDDMDDLDDDEFDDGIDPDLGEDEDMSTDEVMNL